MKQPTDPPVAADNFGQSLSMFVKKFGKHTHFRYQNRYNGQMSTVRMIVLGCIKSSIHHFGSCCRSQGRLRKMPGALRVAF